jgi:hypothetical protein
MQEEAAAEGAGKRRGETGPAGRAGGGGGRESISSPAVECKEECISETVKDDSYKPYQPLLSATTATTNTFHNLPPLPPSHAILDSGA